VGGAGVESGTKTDERKGYGRINSVCSRILVFKEGRGGRGLGRKMTRNKVHEGQAAIQDQSSAHKSSSKQSVGEDG